MYSLFQTVDGSIRTLKQIDRPNFGLTYEPANWLAAGEDYGPRTIARIKPWLMNVYVAKLPPGSVSPGL